MTWANYGRLRGTLQHAGMAAFAIDVGKRPLER
jgi:hypothetical protein